MLAASFADNILYYKRFRMELELAHALPVSALPPGYHWGAWHPTLLDQHAEVKHNCFHEEIDAHVFPNLGNRLGCRHLMREITNRSGFCPEATWLVGCGDGWCGTIQGVCERGGRGYIQNLGVMPLYRGQGLGVALVLKALDGFRRAGQKRAVLEVTAQNAGALRIYRRLGFRCRKTLYKAVESAPKQNQTSGQFAGTVQFERC